MELSELQELLNSENSDFQKATEKIKSSRPSDKFDPEKAIKQLDVRQHKIFDKVDRPDKNITTETENGNKITKPIPVTRIPLSFQKLIVKRAASFLIGKHIKLKATPGDDSEEALLEVLQKIWKDNKLNFKSKTLAKNMMSETETAELWYMEEAEKEYWKDHPKFTAKLNSGNSVRFRMKILSNQNGDKLHPVFNSFGDMIAFGREYQTKINNEQQDHFDIYTDDLYYKGTKQQGKTWEFEKIENKVGKIPVIYYSQDKPEWYDVEDAIERLETLVSNFSDTNDYNGSPVLFLIGNIKKMPNKETSGKVVQGDPGSEAKYVTWDSAPESIKLEKETLENLIYTLTQTPDISFKEMKGLGNISGIALQLLFLDAHLKAQDKQDGPFGECIQRRINYLKAAVSRLNVGFKNAELMDITPEFSSFIPESLEDQITNLVTAVGGKSIMSQKTAVKLNPLVENDDEEFEEIKKESNPVDPLGDEFNREE